jgi:hypothetical protein
MIDEIKQKLDKHFALAPATEADVVYALVQTRKLLERSGEGGKFPRLKFFCDWTVHGKLTGREAKNILLELDDTLKSCGDRQIWEVDNDGKVYDLVSHQGLRRELLDYLSGAGVVASWPKDPFIWHEVCRHYSRILKDCPLTISREDYPHSYLSRLEITACEPEVKIVEANPDSEHIGWTWTFILNDGRSFPMTHTSGIGTKPNGWKTLL